MVSVNILLLALEHRGDARIPQNPTENVSAVADVRCYLNAAVAYADTWTVQRTLKQDMPLHLCLYMEVGAVCWRLTFSTQSCNRIACGAIRASTSVHTYSTIRLIHTLWLIHFFKIVPRFWTRCRISSLPILG